jgi:hypothetical protein
MGGDQNFQPSRLVDIFHPATYHCLMEARLDLAKQLGLRQGPDLGFQEKRENISYLPAYQRYDGVIYQTGEVRQRYIGFGGRVGVENKMGWTGNRHRIVLIFSGQIMVD